MGVIQGYDSTISELKTDYEAQVIDYEKEQKELKELEEHFEKVDATAVLGYFMLYRWRCAQRRFA